MASLQEAFCWALIPQQPLRCLQNIVADGTFTSGGALLFAYNYHVSRKICVPGHCHFTISNAQAKRHGGLARTVAGIFTTTEPSGFRS